MSIAQSLLPEFDQEMQNTRKVLERLPDEKWGWKPAISLQQILPELAKQADAHPDWLRRYS